MAGGGMRSSSTPEGWVLGARRRDVAGWVAGCGRGAPGAESRLGGCTGGSSHHSKVCTIRHTYELLPAGDDRQADCGDRPDRPAGRLRDFGPPVLIVFLYRLCVLQSTWTIAAWSSTTAAWTSAPTPSPCAYAGEGGCEGVLESGKGEGGCLRGWEGRGKAGGGD